MMGGGLWTEIQNFILNKFEPVHEISNNLTFQQV